MADEDVDMDQEKMPVLKPEGGFIFYGSLEKQEWERIEKLKLQKGNEEVEGEAEGEEDIDMVPPGEEKEPVAAVKELEESGGEEKSDKEEVMEEERADGEGGGEAGKEDGEPEVGYIMSEESKRARERQEQLMREFLMKRRARALTVPTNDDAVRQRLRALGEPITLFGEKEMERRDRLRMIMAKMDEEGELDKLEQSMQPAPGSEAVEEEEEVPQNEPFHTEGPEELHAAREYLARVSLRKAAARVAAQKRRRADPDEDEEAECNEVLANVSRTIMECSEIGDDRPLSSCAFSPDASHLVTGGWSGVAKVWTVGPGPRIALSCPLKGHKERVTAVAFHPRSGLDLDAGAANIATGSADKTAIVWGLDGRAKQTFSGHLERLARIAFHPSGLYLGTTSFDKTWRLWDINTGTELLLQEGHSRSVYAIAFQCDGSLAVSGGLDALARVWDLRTGRNILTLEGHVKPIHAVDFSPNGFHVATGSEDHTCRIWDLRKRKCVYIIPAHSSLISQVRYEPSDGHFLATASYDNTVRLWSARDFVPIKTLAGHEGKVMGVDVAPEGQYIATVSYDRTIKLWAQESL